VWTHALCIEQPQTQLPNSMHFCSEADGTRATLSILPRYSWHEATPLTYCGASATPAGDVLRCTRHATDYTTGIPGLHVWSPWTHARAKRPSFPTLHAHPAGPKVGHKALQALGYMPSCLRPTSAEMTSADPAAPQAASSPKCARLIALFLPT